VWLRRSVVFRPGGAPSPGSCLRALCRRGWLARCAFGPWTSPSRLRRPRLLSRLRLCPLLLRGVAVSRRLDTAWVAPPAGLAARRLAPGPWRSSLARPPARLLPRPGWGGMLGLCLGSARFSRHSPALAAAVRPLCRRVLGGPGDAFALLTAPALLWLVARASVDPPCPDRRLRAALPLRPRSLLPASTAHGGVAGPGVPACLRGFCRSGCIGPPFALVRARPWLCLRWARRIGLGLPLTCASVSSSPASPLTAEALARLLSAGPLPPPRLIGVAALLLPSLSLSRARSGLLRFQGRRRCRRAPLPWAPLAVSACAARRLTRRFGRLARRPLGGVGCLAPPPYPVRAFGAVSPCGGRPVCCGCPRPGPRRQSPCSSRLRPARPRAAGVLPLRAAPGLPPPGSRRLRFRSAPRSSDPCACLRPAALWAGRPPSALPRSRSPGSPFPSLRPAPSLPLSPPPLLRPWRPRPPVSQLFALHPSYPPALQASVLRLTRWAAAPGFRASPRFIFVRSSQFGELLHLPLRHGGALASCLLPRPRWPPRPLCAPGCAAAF